MNEKDKANTNANTGNSDALLRDEPHRDKSERESETESNIGPSTEASAAKTSKNRCGGVPTARTNNTNINTNHENEKPGLGFGFGFDSISISIGGPDSRLPRIIEGCLAWLLALACLGVAAWHYHIDQRATASATTTTTNASDASNVSNNTSNNTSDTSNNTANNNTATICSAGSLPTDWMGCLWTRWFAPKPKQPIPGTANTSTSSRTIIGTSTSTSTTCACSTVNNNNNNTASPSNSIVRIPLTTHSRREWATVSESYEGFAARYHQLLCVLSAARARHDSNKDKTIDTDNKTVDALVDRVRAHDAARRLVSLLLASDPIDPSFEKHSRKEEWRSRLIARDETETAGTMLSGLAAAWPRLLKLPLAEGRDPLVRGCNVDDDDSNVNVNDDDSNVNVNVNDDSNGNVNVNVNDSNVNDDSNGDHDKDCELSLVIPSFREDGTALADKLRTSLELASSSSRKPIEVLVVRVATKEENDFENDNNDDNNDDDNNDDTACFARALTDGLASATANANCRLRILDYTGGGGRGPCLNHGAKHATGSFLIFLHADTRLATPCWDDAVVKALSDPQTTCCAFSFAIDRPQSKSQSRSRSQYCPPGLGAIEVTANLRTRWFSLPYGDQCLCLRADVFWFLGGFPDQCLMEDYELVRCLRMRTLHVGRNCAATPTPTERIRILRHHTAVCSPRRWQAGGVLATTLGNSRCVHRYNTGAVTPDGLFCEYYHTQNPPERPAGDKSPWERNEVKRNETK